MTSETGKAKPVLSNKPVLADKPVLAKLEKRVIDVRELVGEGREAVILHEGESYRLRITAKDKLILTK